MFSMKLFERKIDRGGERERESFGKLLRFFRNLCIFSCMGVLPFFPSDSAGGCAARLCCKTEEKKIEIQIFVNVSVCFVFEKRARLGCWP